PNQRLINGQTQLLGAFNQANAALALLMAVELGIDPTVAAAGIARVKTVPGRLEIVKMPDGDNGPLAVVDFAHTPDQITALTSALRPVTKGRLILVIGAGGLRDQGKRPQMGAAAARGADIVLITDDNPRDEDPAEIRAALLAGARRHPTAQVLEIPGRQQAVTKAVALAQGGDTLVLAGKGHETSQEIAGQQQKWDDRQALSKALQEHGPWT
ncbi:MAG: hypothetical protein LBG70_02480, partial [Bifidobacteriaceae bacterium]|nr:hypothetical protein [Bifidobacteriaceae bacterium]